MQKNKPNFDALVMLFEAEHRDPVNRALHIWLGMPLAGLGLGCLACLKVLWGLALLAAGYGVMFLGHYAFEKSPPAVVKTPFGPLSGAAFAIDRLFRRPFRRMTRSIRAGGASQVNDRRPARWR